MILRPKPWWLRLVTPRWFWITLNPRVYYPKGVNPWTNTAIVAHEQVHLVQQARTGLLAYLLRYWIQPSFRLAVEVEAMAVELRWMEGKGVPSADVQTRFEECVRQLSGKAYFWAATPNRARSVLNKALERTA